MSEPLEQAPSDDITPLELANKALAKGPRGLRRAIPWKNVPNSRGCQFKVARSCANVYHHSREDNCRTPEAVRCTRATRTTGFRQWCTSRPQEHNRYLPI